MENVLEQIMSILRSDMRVSIENAEIKFEELKWDSLDIVQFVIHLEQKFDIELEEIVDLDMKLCPATLAPKIVERINATHKP